MKQTLKNKNRRVKNLFVPKGIFTVLFIVFLSQLKGQDPALFYVNGEIRISEENILFIPGALITDENAYFDNGGEVYVTDSLVNQSFELFKPSSYGKMDNSATDPDDDDKFYLKLNIGKIIFINENPKIIQNNNSILFDTVVFDTPDTTLLKGDSTIVLGSLVFQNGHFNINSDTILMYYETSKRKPRMSGTLANESDIGRVIDPSGKGSIEMAKEIATSELNDPYAKFHTLGIVPKGAGGLTKIRRFHYFDTLVTDTSIGRVFELVSTQDVIGGNDDMTIYYINSPDLPASMRTDSLGIWFYGPIDEIPTEMATDGEDGADYRYDATGTGYSNLYFPSYETGVSQGDSVTGNTILKPGYRYTAAEINCDNGPDIFLEPYDTICAGGQAILNPFARSSSELEDYFYMWHSSADSLIKPGRRSAQSIQFIANKALIDSTIKFWVNVRDYRGCHSSDTSYITVKGGNNIGIRFLEADTTPGSSSLCTGTPFMARDTINVDMDILRHTWWFSNGDTLSDKHALVGIQLDEPGQYRLNVSYVNEFGCKVSKRDIPVIMHPYPQVSMQVGSPVCQNTMTPIENNSSVAPIGDGNAGQSAITSYTWTINGKDSIIVKQDITDACSLEFETLPLKAGEITAPGLKIKFVDEGWAQIVLKARTLPGCTSYDTAMAYINLPAVPDIDPSALTNVCQGLPSIFVPGDSCAHVKPGGYSWKTDPYQPWDNSDTASFVFPQSGKFPVWLAVVSDSGCKDTTSAMVTIHPNTKANFTFQSHCVGLTSVFRDSLASGATLYFWDFGDGTTATDNVPEHSISNKYDTAGTYPVTLISNNEWGCADTVAKNIEIYPLPYVYFEADPVICINAQKNILHNYSEGATEYYWEFSDNTHSARTEPDKKFSMAGTYNITLTGISAHGCQAGASQNIDINGVVTASYDPALPSVCRGNSSEFLPNSDLSGLSRIHWDFDNGDTASTYTADPGILYTYPAEGTYIAQMITYSTNNCTDTVSYQVLVHPNPQIHIVTEGQACSGEEIIFRPDDGINIEEITDFLWDYGDESMPGSNPTVSHFYPEARTYQVTVGITTQQGCRGYDTLSLAIDSLPEFPFAGETSTCENSLELLAGPPAYQYLWSDGSTGNSLVVSANGIYGVTITNPGSGCTNSGTTEVSLSAEVLPGLGADRATCDLAMLDAHNPGAKSYTWSTGGTSRIINVTTSGTYWVEVEDINGCIGRDTIEVTVNTSPKLTLPAVLSSCGGEAVTIDPGAGSGTYNWNTGATTSTITTDRPGTYFVSVTDANGCTGNALTNLTFYPVPIVYLGEDITTCEGNPVLLNAGNTGATYQWSDGSIAATLSPVTSGTYHVAVTNKYTCMGHDTINITINPLPVIDLGGDQSICSGNGLLLDAGLPGSNYYWSTGETARTIDVSNAGYYWVRVTDGNGCSSLTDPVRISLREAPFDPFVSDSISACKFVLLDADNPGSDYLWDDNNTGRNYLAEESGLRWVKITNAESCSTTDSVYVTIKPVADLDLPDETEICSNGHGFIDAGYYGDDYTYSWNVGSTTQYIRVESEGMYQVDVTHAEGCVSTDSTQVVALPAPEISLGHEILMCENSSLELNAGTPGSLYSWGSSNGLEYSGQILPLSDTGTYWVRVMAANGCTSSDTVHVLHTGMSIRPLFLAASKIAIGDTVRFVDLSVPVPTSYFWDFGDMITSTEDGPMHIYYAEGTFDAMLTVGNGTCNASITKPLTVKGYNPDYLKKMAKEYEKLKHPDLILITEAKVYPNPARDYLKVDIDITQESDVIMHLYGLDGRIHAIRKFDDTDHIEYSFNVSGLARGLYFLRVATINEVKTFKVLKE